MRSNAKTSSRLNRKAYVESLERRYALSTVSGVVFNDTNGNGSQDTGETGLQGWTVFLDANRDEIADPAEVSQISAADGSYSFSVPEGRVQYPSVVLQADDGSGTGRWLNTTDKSERVPIPVGTDPNSTFTRNFGLRFVPYSSFYPVGTESLVNQTTIGREGANGIGWGDGGSVASDAAGNYAVAWVQLGDNLQDRVFVRLFRADGTARTGEIEVGVRTRMATEIEIMPLVAMSKDGTRFVVAWTNSLNEANRAPFARLYSVSGDSVAAVGAQIQVNPYSSKAYAILSGVAMDGDGDFVVLFNGSEKSGIFTNYGISHFQRFSKTGAFVGKKTQVVDAVSVSPRLGISMDSTGNFVVAWSDSGGIRAQRYTASGSKAGGLITVSSVGDIPAVTMNASGRFAVSWLEPDPTWENNYHFIQVYSSSGQPIGSKVIAGREGTMEHAGLAMDALGNVTLTWVANPADVANSATSREIYVRRLSSTGILSDPMIVNTTTEGIQNQPAVASIGTDRFVVAWAGRGVGDDVGVFSQRYTTTAATIQSSEADIALMQLLVTDEFVPNRKKR